MGLKRVLVVTDRNFSTSLGRTATLFCDALSHFFSVNCAVVVSRRFFPSISDIEAIPKEYAVVKTAWPFGGISVDDAKFTIKGYDFVVLSHQYMGYLIPSLKRKFKNSKVVTMVHDIFPFMLYKPSLKSFLLKKFFFDGIFKSDGLVFNSENSKDIFTAVFEKKRVIGKTSSVGLGVNTQEFYSVTSAERELFREKWGVDKSKKVVFNIGLGEWRKNNRLFVFLAENMPDYLFLRLGKFEPELNDCIQKLGNIRVLSNVPADQVRELYNIADVYVMPSYFEGFSLTGLEAMCCSTPVVASYMSAHREIYEGLVEFVHDPDNVEGFADKIEAVLRKDFVIDKERLAQRLDYYSNIKFGERMAGFFESMAIN